MIITKTRFKLLNITNLKFEQNPDYYAQTCDICQQYVAHNSGAVNIIYEKINFDFDFDYN